MGIIDEMKKSASKSGVKLQTADETKLEYLLNRTFFLDKNIEKETAFIKHIMTRGQESSERVGLHASSFIKSDADFCLREQVLSLVYRQLQGEQIPPGLMRIFEEGNSVHEKWQRLFIRAGFSDVLDLDFTRINKKFRISFTPDIICEIPEFYKGKMVGEIKSMNTHQFKRGNKHPSAGKQLQWYMYLTGIHKGFVLVEDKNDQNFRIELYDYDSKIVEPYIDRAQAVKNAYIDLIKNKRMIKRPAFAKTKDSKRCEKCVMKLSCYNLKGGKVKIKC